MTGQIPCIQCVRLPRRSNSATRALSIPRRLICWSGPPCCQDRARTARCETSPTLLARARAEVECARASVPLPAVEMHPCVFQLVTVARPLRWVTVARAACVFDHQALPRCAEAVPCVRSESSPAKMPALCPRSLSGAAAYIEFPFAPVFHVLPRGTSRSSALPNMCERCATGLPCVASRSCASSVFRLKDRRCSYFTCGTHDQNNLFMIH